MPVNGEVDLADLRQNFSKKFPTLTSYFWDELTAQTIGKKRERKAKEITDPVWHSISIRPVEVDLLDMPLMQRLRRVRQLGLAYLVYPGAQHTRFDHSIGAMEAASRIYDQLEESKSGPQAKGRFRDIVRLAALLHDAGHPAFSHVAERVLERTCQDEFSGLLNELDAILPAKDHLSIPQGESAHRAAPKLRKIPAAEIVSVLFVLSKPMEELLGSYGIPSESIPRIAAMIRGYPWAAWNDTRTTHDDFLKAIVSGDMDSDKLDYVSRDSLFSGIPVAADVRRLLNQLTVLKIRDKEHDRAFDQYVFGVKRGGIAAVEMFVMTRAYLHDRLYSHPKTRAAEQRLERVLEAYRSQADPKDFMRLIYNPCGDDAVLDRLLQHDGQTRSVYRVFIERNLPQRALAIVRRYLVGYDSRLARLSMSVTKSYTNADSRIPQQLPLLNEKIAEIAGAEYPDDVIVDWSKPNPVKEDPALWVSQFQARDYSRDNPPPPISAHFNVEQLSNAYQDAKLAAWVFAAPGDRERVSAAAALVFASSFGLQVTSEALDHARIDKRKFVDEVNRITAGAGIGEDIKQIAGGLINILDDKLFVPWKSFSPAFRGAGWKDANSDTCATKITKAINTLDLPIGFYGEVDAAIAALNVALRYRHKLRGERDDKWTVDEDAMQKDFIRFVSSDSKLKDEFRAYQHPKTPAGISDVVLDSYTSRAQVVIELKSTEESFEAIQKKYASQPLWYAATENYGRVTILCARYRAETPATDDEDVAVWRNANASLACIAVGIPIPKKTASKQKNTSVRAG